MTNSNITIPRLTKYTPAGLAELWSIAYPLMLTALSGNLMIFMDRLLLCRYVPDAMVAVSTVGMVFTIFQFAGISVASIAEVYVGKYNGANEGDKIGPLVWQMIWFSLITAIVFIPVGLFCGKLFLPEEYYHHGLLYFKTIMIFGPLFPLVAALSSFFIGQGKVKIITLSTLVVNIINIIFAYVFIFGIEGVIPAMGTFGAALALGFSILLQAIFLFAVFINKKYRILNNTGCFKLERRMLQVISLK
jgi:MATE family multidrug resistance protein